MRIFLLLVFLGIFPSVVFTDIVPRASHCTKSIYLTPNDEFDRVGLLNCYDELWAKPNGSIFFTSSFEGWWLRCREEFADDDDARLACFIENNFWEKAFVNE